MTHQHRDTLSSIVGHPTLASYLAIADGEAIGRVKFEMTEVRTALDISVRARPDPKTPFFLISDL